MRIFAAISMTLGLTLMTVPLVLPRLGGVEGLMQAAGLQPKAGPAQQGGEGILGGAVSAVSGAMKALTGGASAGQMVSTTGPDGKILPAPDMSGQLGAACKLMALRTGQSEGDCKAQLGPLAKPDGMQGLMDEVAKAMEGAGAAPGLAAPPPAGITPRISAQGGREARRSGGGAKFVKVNK